MLHLEQLLNQLKADIKTIANSDKKKWWENYLQNAIPFLGVGIPDLRNILKTWHKINRIKLLPIDRQLEITELLMKENIAEYKISAILFFQIFLLKNCSSALILETIQDYFKKEYIYDWNTCDWLCVRILTPLINNEGKKTAQIISCWHVNKNVWHARASLVAFAQIKELEKYLELLKVPMQVLIEREERFAKTAVGWLLREISKFDKQFVYDFLEAEKKYLTNEVVKNALKYSPKTEIKKFLP